MALPGLKVVIKDTAPPRTPPTDTGMAFVVGLADRGPLTPVQVDSLADFVTTFGGRQTYSLLYDWLDVYFHEGGAHAFVSRVVGPAATVATLMLKDSSAANTLLVSANSPGAWGATLSVAVLAPLVSGFRLQVSDSTGVLETSPDLADKAAAITWAQGSSYITLTDEASANPPVAASAAPLTGGDDDRGSVTDTERAAALARFGLDLGPGQVAMPGSTTDQAHTDLLAHAAANYRVALIDLADTATVATLTDAAEAARSDGRWGGAFTPWAVVPGIVGQTTRTVPYSAVAAGIIARNDGQGLPPGQPAAGNWGQALYATGLSQPAFTDADRETLNDTGVNVALVRFGAVETYGFRSLADPDADPAWVQLTAARIVMAVAAGANATGSSFVFSQLDGAGVTIGNFGNALTADLDTFYKEGSLYGTTAADAYAVNVGPAVNTPASIQAGELNAHLEIVPSPFGEVVEIDITKSTVTQGVI